MSINRLKFIFTKITRLIEVLRRKNYEKLDEKTFRWMLNEDEMANDKFGPMEFENLPSMQKN